MSETKRIDLDKIKHLADVCSKDPTRLALNCVKVDVENKRYTACNGYMMASVAFDKKDIEAYENSFLIPRETLKQMTKGRKNIYSFRSENDKAVFNVDGLDYAYSLTEYPNIENYPPLDKVEPVKTEDDLVLRFNYELLNSLGKALADSRSKAIDLRVHKNISGNWNTLGAMSITGTNGNGVLMPMRG